MRGIYKAVVCWEFSIGIRAFNANAWRGFDSCVCVRWTGRIYTTTCVCLAQLTSIRAASLYLTIYVRYIVYRFIPYILAQEGPPPFSSSLYTLASYTYIHIAPHYHPAHIYIYSSRVQTQRVAIIYIIGGKWTWRVSHACLILSLGDIGSLDERALWVLDLSSGRNFKTGSPCAARLPHTILLYIYIYCRLCCAVGIYLAV